MSKRVDGREIILERIRKALATPERGAAPAASSAARPFATMADGGDYVERLVERLLDYGAKVHRTDEAHIGAITAEICARANLGSVLVPEGMPRHWLPSGVNLQVDDRFSPETLDHFDAVFTGCMCAIAETGTIILRAGAGQGRRAITLVPDVHICVVKARDVVSSVPQAIELIGQANADVWAPVTLISGPSATSDIELKRVEGVHGPRTLYVLISS